MSMILLAVEDAQRDARVRELLTRQGWWVTTVANKEEALRAAADHAPQLLILDRGVADPAGLLSVFSRESGGCGVLVLIDRMEDEAVGFTGDGVVGRDEPDEAFVAKVRDSLDAPRAAQKGAGVSEAATDETDDQLGSRELFGDILEDLAGGADDPRTATATTDDRATATVTPAPAREPLDEVVGERPAEEPVPEGSSVEKLAPSEEPAVEDPPVEEPPVEEPPREEPPIERPPVEEPPVEEPPVERPPIEEPPIEEPVVERPAVEEPVVEEPAIEPAPVAEAPVEVPVPADIDAAAGPLPEESEAEPAEEGEPTTDLVEEVADLLDADPDERADDTDSGVGLLIDEVLAVESEGEAEDSASAEAPAAPTAPGEGSEFERTGGYELVELMEHADLTERWLARRVEGDGKRVLLERVRFELRNRADVRDAFVEGNSDAAGWEHANVLSVLDLGREGEVDFVVTQYRPGHSLGEVLDRVARMEGRMPLGICLLLLERLGAALAVLGEGPASARHGWLVPASVWLTDEGEVLLREFGVGRLATLDDSLVRDWTDHRFAAPERWSERGDIRSDLYSLGALFYEMVTGRPVHRASDYEALVEAIAAGSKARAQEVDSTIPSEVDSWVMRLLRRDPGERPQSVSEVLAKIDLAMQALPVRPTSAELNAYVRQLFAARVPEARADAPPGDEEEIGLEETTEGEETVAARTGLTWWWLLIPLLALLGMFIGWKLMAGGEGAAGSQFERNGVQSVEARRAVGEADSTPVRTLQ